MSMPGVPPATRWRSPPSSESKAPHRVRLGRPWPFPPPLTDPARSPAEETAMVAPTGRGAEPSTLTTVAIATWLPAERQASTSGRTSFMGASHFSTGRARLMRHGHGASLASMVAGAVQSSSGKQIDAGEACFAPPSRDELSGRGRRRHEAAHGRLVLDLSKEIGERFQALQIVDRQKLVDVGHGGPHTLRERLVTWRAKERVEPDETAAGALQARHLPAEQFRISPVPAITDDHHRGTGAEDAARPLIVEGLDRLADARTAG